jgi:hypothetical protein
VWLQPKWYTYHRECIHLEACTWSLQLIGSQTFVLGTFTCASIPEQHVKVCWVQCAWLIHWDTLGHSIMPCTLSCMRLHARTGSDICHTAST